MPPKSPQRNPLLAGPTATGGIPGPDNTGQLFTAALLEAARSDCRCNTCAILRQIADRLRAQMVPAASEG